MDRSHASNPEAQDHTVSAAKGIDPQGLEGTRLENAPDLGAAFDQGAGNDGLGPPQGIGSQQVKDSGQNHDMTPSPDIAEPADRNAHIDRMSGDELRALREETKAILQSLESKGVIDRSQERGHDQSQDHDFDR